MIRRRLFLVSGLTSFTALAMVAILVPAAPLAAGIAVVGGGTAVVTEVIVHVHEHHHR